MKFLVSNLMRKLAEGISAGIGRDDYLEQVEREKKDLETTKLVPKNEKDQKPIILTKDKEKEYKSSPKIKPPRRQPSFKNKWDSNDTRREYQQEYRLEHGNT